MVPAIACHSCHVASSHHFQLSFTNFSQEIQDTFGKNVMTETFSHFSLFSEQRWINGTKKKNNEAQVLQLIAHFW